MATLDTSSLDIEELLTAAMLLRNDGDLHNQLAAQAGLEGDSLDRQRRYAIDRYNTAQKFDALRTHALSNGDMILVANLLRQRVDNYTEMANAVGGGNTELSAHYSNEAARYQRHLDKFLAIVDDYDTQIKKEFNL